MKILTVFCFILYASSVCAQNIEFSPGDDTKKVFMGDVVTIKADTAYVVSKTRAMYLNKKLGELAEIKVLYNDLAENRNKLLDNLSHVQKLVSSLLVKMKNDSSILSANIDVIISDLSKTLEELKTNNDVLKSNNTELLSKVNQLERIVKDLKRETRWIWWNGLADKLVVLAGGIGIGFLLGKL